MMLCALASLRETKNMVHLAKNCPNLTPKSLINLHRGCLAYLRTH